MDAQSEDEREVELSSISAIFPEIVLEAPDPFSASIDLPVTPIIPLPVVCPESAELPNSSNGSKARIETHLLSHLPNLRLRITLPLGYPTNSPPSFELSTSPNWLPAPILDRLRADGERLWEEFGRDQVVFAYIDHLLQGTEDTFGVLEGNESLQVPQDLKISLLDFDIKAKRAAFEKLTFDCGVCLDPKKGIACYKMLDCGHVYCRQCLQDFYNNAITEGDLPSVKCLAPDCAKNRSRAGKSQTGKRRKPKTRISANELLQIPLEHDMVKRYVTLKHKAELESDRNTIYCPRKWCQGAARSRKHRKPSQFLGEADSSDEESEDGSESAAKAPDRETWVDRLSVCEDCSFAFCSRCYQGWHGELMLCAPPRNNGELTEEEKASQEYLRLHTTPCPTCSAPAQKTHGCNHMICSKCESHFCYLCSAWLDSVNPYKHYNVEGTLCYMRLWALEEGDGDNVDRWALQERPWEEAAPNQGAQARDVVGQPNIAPGAIAEPVIEAPAAAPADAEPVNRLVEPLVAREGPLVLRINQVPPRAPVAAPAAPVRNAPPPRRPAQQPNRRPMGNFDGRAIGARHAAAAAPGRRVNQQPQPQVQPPRLPAQPAARDAAAPAPPPAAGLGAADQLWVENFVRMALADEEDQVEWDSDEEDDMGWQIPVR